ncbi:hypothetical protein ZIOFF_025460 [Zingiber officinale]|uniref:Serine hydroxymethyltransferase-like domain-containing protein n=1 Tax=Zingiber officinale TaxID=94328 RepID=A0A8J5GVX4_ZINOF|nr:hypothetical protein ZIOFF_025460 [Zingiber officinale]
MEVGVVFEPFTVLLGGEPHVPIKSEQRLRQEAKRRKIGGEEWRTARPIVGIEIGGGGARGDVHGTAAAILIAGIAHRWRGNARSTFTPAAGALGTESALPPATGFRRMVPEVSSHSYPYRIKGRRSERIPTEGLSPKRSTHGGPSGDWKPTRLSLLEKSSTLFRPKLIVAGDSVYARLYDYACIRKVCDKHKAILVADMAHISGLVAGGVIPSPFEYADIVTTTTHKSLRGPRGAMIFFRKGVKDINKQVEELLSFEYLQATTPEYKAYQEEVLSNCARFAQSLVSKGYELVSGGTKNHLVLVNLKNKGIDGSRVEKVLELVHIAANKTTVPVALLHQEDSSKKILPKLLTFLDTAVNLAMKIKTETKDTNIQSEIKQLRHDVEEYAKQFSTIGFEKETMKYKECKDEEEAAKIRKYSRGLTRKCSGGLTRKYSRGLTRKCSGGLTRKYSGGLIRKYSGGLIRK